MRSTPPRHLLGRPRGDCIGNDLGTRAFLCPRDPSEVTGGSADPMRRLRVLTQHGDSTEPKKLQGQMPRNFVGFFPVFLNLNSI